MKNILLGLIVLMTSCTSNRNQKEKIVENSEIDTAALVSNQETVQDINFNEKNSEPLAWNSFEMIFMIEKYETKQKLGVSVLSNNLIEFRLNTENELCNIEYWGKAKNLYPEGDPEIDEDECNVAYPSREFILENKDYMLSVRISLDEDKAKILYHDKTATEADCIPAENLVLKNKAKDETKIEEVTTQFINTYLADADKSNDNGWIQQNQRLTNDFKESYKDLIDQAYQDEPEMGLGFDPILNAQDYPEEGFEMKSYDKTTGRVVLSGRDYSDFIFNLIIVYQNCEWLIDGAGIINIPEEWQEL